MTAKIINGNEIAQQIREELKKEVAAIKAKHNVVPGLVTILVGEEPASVSYVTAKQRTSHDLDFYSIQDTSLQTLPKKSCSSLLMPIIRIAKFTAFWFSSPCPSILMKKRC